LGEVLLATTVRKSVLRHLEKTQDAELSTIRQFLRERAVANGYGQRISSVRELEVDRGETFSGRE
jgi:hypothetical protein